MALSHWLIFLAFIVLAGTGYWLLPESLTMDIRRTLGLRGPDTLDDGVGSDSNKSVNNDYEPSEHGKDSYIVSIRTLTPDPTTYGISNGIGPLAPFPDNVAEAHWQAHKRSFDTSLGDPPLTASSSRIEDQTSGAEVFVNNTSGSRTDISDTQEESLELESDCEPWDDIETKSPQSEGADNNIRLDIRLKESNPSEPQDLPETEEVEPEPRVSSPRNESRYVPDSGAQESEIAQARQHQATLPESDKPALGVEQMKGQPEPDFDDSGSARVSRQKIEPQPRLQDKQELFVIHVVAGHKKRYSGPTIHQALASLGLYFGFGDLYHRAVERDDNLISTYAVANMVNPGTLHPTDQNKLVTPGLTLFMVAPGTESAPATLHEMMETAHALRLKLGGQVLDHQQSELTAQTARYMLDHAVELDRRVTTSEIRTKIRS